MQKASFLCRSIQAYSRFVFYVRLSLKHPPKQEEEEPAREQAAEALICRPQPAVLSIFCIVVNTAI